MLSLIMFSLLSCSNKPEQKGSVKNIELKTFTFEDLKNELKNKKTDILIINFWATWCGECRKEMPDLIAFYDKFKDKVKSIGLSLDESKDDVRKFMEIAKVNFPVYMSSKKLTQHLMVNGIPVTYIFKNGKYAKYHIGQYQYFELKEDITNLLKK